MAIVGGTYPGGVWSLHRRRQLQQHAEPRPGASGLGRVDRAGRRRGGVPGRLRPAGPRQPVHAAPLRPPERALVGQRQDQPATVLPGRLRPEPARVSALRAVRRPSSSNRSCSAPVTTTSQQPVHQGRAAPAAPPGHGPGRLHGHLRQSVHQRRVQGLLQSHRARQRGILPAVVRQRQALGCHDDERHPRRRLAVLGRHDQLRPQPQPGRSDVLRRAVQEARRRLLHRLPDHPPVAQRLGLASEQLVGRLRAVRDGQMEVLRLGRRGHVRVRPVAGRQVRRAEQRRATATGSSTGRSRRTRTSACSLQIGSTSISSTAGH